MLSSSSVLHSQSSIFSSSGLVERSRPLSCSCWTVLSSPSILHPQSSIFSSSGLVERSRPLSFSCRPAVPHSPLFTLHAQWFTGFRRTTRRSRTNGARSTGRRESFVRWRNVVVDGGDDPKSTALLVSARVCTGAVDVSHFAIPLEKQRDARRAQALQKNPHHDLVGIFRLFPACFYDRIPSYCIKCLPSNGSLPVYSGVTLVRILRVFDYDGAFP